MQIDFSYDMISAGHPPGQGYDTRPPGTMLQGLVWHSTNGQRGSTFDAEALWLRDNGNVSAHYLIGQQGQIARLLDPIWRAWHAGVSAWGGFTDLNDMTIGIECLHAIGDPWPPIQLQMLLGLCQQLQHDHPSLEYLCAHRWCAQPPGRRSDPDDLLDCELHAFGKLLGLRTQ